MTDGSAPPVPSSAPSVREALLRARAEKRCALIPYVTLGHPSLEASLALLEALEAMGVDAVEVGIPFSDPVADGPTIQRTIERALAQGVTLRTALTGLEQRIQAGPGPGPRVLFSYFNPLLALGLAALPARVQHVGIRAVLVTDLIPEEADEWLALAREHGVETCFLAASTSDEDRLERAARASTGFVYCISTLGVTGARGRVDPAAEETVQRLRRHTDVPVAVGFGIARPQDVRNVARFADGAVIGSALLDALGNATQPEDVAHRGVDFLRPFLEVARA